ncbi:MAG: thioesterase family protein [Actinomycetota bacterium]
MTDAFYIAHDHDRFLATEWTRGPWGPDAQHAGPPAALLGRAIERAGSEGMQVARITFEIHKPVPLAMLQVGTEILRRGRRVELVASSLSSEGEEVMRATATRIRTAPLELPRQEIRPPHAIPASSASTELFPATWHPNYLEAMEWRFARGTFTRPGPAAAWVHMRHPLVAGEPVTPLTRVLAAVDSSSGISAELDWTEWLFINPDLSVHLHSLPRGEWILLDALTVTGPAGRGTASSTIYDEHGQIGHSLQSLYLSRRS